MFIYFYTYMNIDYICTHTHIYTNIKTIRYVYLTMYFNNNIWVLSRNLKIRIYKDVL